MMRMLPSFLSHYEENIRNKRRVCRSWQTEGIFRMLLNTLHKDVGESPESLVVYGGMGKAARSVEDLEVILGVLKRLEKDETLLVQSGRAAGVFRTHVRAPRVLLGNSNLVPKWCTWSHFHELDKKGLMMYGQMTAGSWMYIGAKESYKGLMRHLQRLGGSIMEGLMRGNGF